MNNVIGLSEFKFDSLRKYMTPFYDSLRVESSSAPSEKEKIIANKVREFLLRLRTYRERSLSDIAESSKTAVTLADLELYESGLGRCTREIEDAYCKACNGYQELGHFSEQLRAFKDPKIRESQNAVAKDVLKRFGLMMPLVNYQNLNGNEGQVLEFKR